MIITKTPLRISLLGGNTDFPAYFNVYGGAVLTVAINKYVYCIVKKRFDNEIWINYSIKEKVKHVDQVKHDLVREAMKLVGVTEGIEITFLSDIPSEGSGLGSSSAVVVGLLNALHAYRNESVTQWQLAQEACRIELEILKKPIGVQDQYAVAIGGCKKFKFKKSSLFGKKGAIEYVSLNDHFQTYLQDKLILFYTGKTRKADKILSKMKLNKKILDKNKDLVDEGIKGLQKYRGWGFALTLHKYWDLKKKLNKAVSNRQINRLYSKALRNGALGGKIVGAGGGGFLLLVVPSQDRKRLTLALGLKELEFSISRHGSQIVFSDE